MSILDDSLVEVGRVSDPLSDATKSSPAKGIFRINRIKLTTTDPGDLDRLRPLGFVGLGEPDADKATAIVVVKDAGSSHLRFEGDFFVDAVTAEGEAYPPIPRISAMFPLAKDKAKPESSWTNWVNGSTESAPIWTHFGHPLAYSPALKRNMPKVNLADDEGLSSGRDLMTILGKLAGELAGQTHDVAGLGIYTDKGRGANARAENRLVPIGA